MRNLESVSLSNIFVSGVRVLFCTFCVLFSAQSKAEELNVKQVAELTIEELLSIEVTGVSKRSETQQMAPGVVYVVTRTDIERYGANNLHDVLRRVPGLYPVGMYVLRNNVTSIRGQHAAAIDRHVLLLINGRPFRDVSTGGVNGAFYRSFPLDAIERIEVIRGPGSVIYGSNAFSGIINVITATGDNAPAQRVALGYGSFNTVRGEASLHNSSDSLEYHLSAQGIDSKGWDYHATDILGNVGSDREGRQDVGVLADVHYDSLRLQYFRGKADSNIIGTFPVFPFEEHRNTREFINAGVEHELFEGWQLQLDFTHNFERREVEDNSIDIRSHGEVYEAAVTGEITPDLNFLTGALYHDHSGSHMAGSGVRSPIQFSNAWRSGYVQLDYIAWEDTKIVAGMQYNNIGHGMGSDSALRGAFVHKFDRWWGFKLLYGEAYRSPYGTEQTIDVPGVVKGALDLKSETIQTTDLQFFYHGTDLMVELTGFHSEISDAIVAGLPYRNAGELESWGGEWNARFQLNRAHLEGSVSYQHNEDENGLEDVQIVPNTMVKIGAGYDFEDGVSIGVFDNFFSAPTDRKRLNPDTGEFNPRARAYHHLTAHIRFDVQELFDRPDWPEIFVELFGDNLLESRHVFHTDLHRGGSPGTRVNTFPLRPERSVFAKFVLNLDSLN